MNELIDKVIQWANDRNIISGSTPIKQHDKLIEEVIETRDAIVSYSLDYHHQSTEEIKDGIGDSIVCLINLASMYGVSLEECLQQAYDEIKHRKGEMVNGIFVKETN